MPERLVVAQTVAQGLLQRGQGLKEPMMGRTAPPYLPEACDHLPWWTVAGQPVQLQMGHLLEYLGDQSAAMPGGMVDHQHDAPVLRGWIGPSGITPGLGQRFLPAPLPRRRLLSL